MQTEKIGAEADAGGVNAHFLQHLVTLAAEEEVKASEDVYSASGVKLLSQGARISEGTYERIVSHKLMKPLENSISVGDPVTPEALHITAEMLLDASPSLARLISTGKSVDAVLAVLKAAHIGEQAGSLLKLHESRLPSSLSHGVLVGLLATGIMKRLRPADRGALDRLIVASVFHDIGELYIDPLLHQSRDTPLDAEAWRQVAAHPMIGHTVLGGMSGIPPAVADLVLEHHERIDGWGYPQGRQGTAVSQEGHVLAVAEMLSQFVGKQSEPFAHAEVALKIIPGEFGHAVIDAVAACREELCVASQLQHEIDAAAGRDAGVPDFQGGIGSLFMKIGRVCEVMAVLEKETSGLAPEARRLLVSCQQRMDRITRAVSSTGLDLALQGVALGELSDVERAQIQIEFEVTVKEVRWRLIELSRRLMLRRLDLPREASERLQPLIDALAAPT